jgi:hypothetical protein
VPSPAPLPAPVLAPLPARKYKMDENGGTRYLKQMDKDASDERLFNN